MIMRILGVVTVVAMFSASSQAQYLDYGAPIGGPAYISPPRSRFSIRSPFFSMDLTPYGGRYSASYPSFAGPGFSSSGREFPVPLPVPYPGVSPRGWLPPGIRYSGRSFGVPSPGFDIVLPGAEPSVLPNEDDIIGNPDLSPVPAPQYEVPSYTDVFPEDTDLENAGDRVIRDLRSAVSRLNRALGEEESGRVWIEYLRLTEVAELAESLATIRTLEEMPVNRAKELLVNFEAAAGSPNLDWLQALSGFEDIRAILGSINNVQTLPVEPEGGYEASVDEGVEELPAPTGNRTRKFPVRRRAEL